MGQFGHALGDGRSEPPLFFIGRNSRGQWVVQDQHHRRGGVFIGREQALRYALFENGNRPRAVVMVPDVLELDMRSAPLQMASAAVPARKAA